MSLLHRAMLCLWKVQTDKLGCGECWQTAVVLIPNYGKSPPLIRKLLYHQQLDVVGQCCCVEYEIYFQT